MSPVPATRTSWPGAQRLAAYAALVFVPLCALLVWLAPAESMRSYLLAFIFWFGLAGGSLGLLLLHQLVGGQWGRPIRVHLYCAASTLPLMALLFVPITFSVHRVYPWSAPDAAAHDPLLEPKLEYLNEGAYLARAAAFFAIWLLLWLLLTWLGRTEGRAGGFSARALSATAALGLVLYVLSMTFASIDWVMSLDPHWISPVFGLSFVSGQALQALALAALVCAWAVPLRSEEVRSGAFRDVGNLLLALLMLWGYLAFSQYLIIWSANLPEEVAYYTRRSGGWRLLAWALLAGHFLLPFLLLLHGRTKVEPRRLAMVAGIVLFMRLADVVWLAEPSLNRGRLLGMGLSLAMIVGIGSLWVSWYVAAQRWRLRHSPAGPPQAGAALEGGVP